MSGKKRSSLEMAKEHDANEFRMSSSQSTCSDSSRSVSQGSRTDPKTIPAAVLAFLKANDYKIVADEPNLEPGFPLTGLKKSNVPPIYDKSPDFSMKSEELAINPRCYAIIKDQPRCAGLVASCMPPEVYVLCGDTKISLLRHVKALVALTYFLQSRKMEKADIKFEVAYQ